MADVPTLTHRRLSGVITYSPKVFIPLTQLCRDRCGYCTFAHSPRSNESAYLEPHEVLAIAVSGAEAGCHEALFTLGESPETRYPQARDWLSRHGYASTIDYLAAMCQFVLDETGLLPHANAGAISLQELATLRRVSASQGMMLESLRDDLPAHRGAPDKNPERRLATLHAAGHLAIPFTTGILVGIGETAGDRVDALEAIAAAHQDYGHVQEVIIQNFVPKADTRMRHAPACSLDELLSTIEVARTILPSSVHLQAPPNLVDDPGLLLDAGIDDFGGVSPVTLDHVNPEMAWPAVDDLRRCADDRGLALVPRLTIHPEFAREPRRWLDENLRFPVLDRSDASGYGRDDVGAVFPERHEAAANVGLGAEVVQIGRRSTAWYAGADRNPAVLVTRELPIGGPVSDVLAGVELGQEPGLAEIVSLFHARGPEVAAIAAAADRLRHRANGDIVTFVRNRNINYTNVCTFKCSFCGFSKGPLSLNLRGRPYLLTDAEIAQRVSEAAALGATEVTLQGGIHPDFDGDYYVHVCEVVKDAAPDMHIHGFTALEITEGARRLGVSLTDYLLRLKEAGLASLPGTAAEILDDGIREILCPDKVTTQEWLDCHEIAHGIGLPSTVTIMFGSVEEPVHWARHLVRVRDLQKRTGGFTEFIPLSFVHMASPIYLKRRARRGPTWRETVLMHAVGRIAFAGWIDNVQASWVKLGQDGVRQLLKAGVNDLGGTLMDETISRAAGASHGQGMTREGFKALLEPLGRPLVERTTIYGPVSQRIATWV